MSTLIKGINNALRNKPQGKFPLTNLVIIDENLPIISLENAVVVSPKDFETGLPDVLLYELAKQATHKFSRVLIISLDYDFEIIRLQEIIDNKRADVDIINLNLPKTARRKLLCPTRIADSTRKIKQRAILWAYKNWLKRST